MEYSCTTTLSWKSACRTIICNEKYLEVKKSRNQVDRITLDVYELLEDAIFFVLTILYNASLSPLPSTNALNKLFSFPRRDSGVSNSFWKDINNLSIGRSNHSLRCDLHRGPSKTGVVTSKLSKMANNMRKKTHDFISIHDGLQAMCHCNNSYIGIQFTPKSILYHGVCLVI